MPAVAMKRRPAPATVPSATRHGTFIPTTTDNAKKKLCPIGRGREVHPLVYIFAALFLGRYTFLR